MLCCCCIVCFELPGSDEPAFTTVVGIACANVGYRGFGKGGVLVRAATLAWAAVPKAPPWSSRLSIPDVVIRCGALPVVAGMEGTGAGPVDSPRARFASASNAIRSQSVLPAWTWRW